MSCAPPRISPCGTWEVIYRREDAPIVAGYGSSSWTYELIERATGARRAVWSGGASVSPWEASSHGTADVRWDGELLAIEDCADARIQRVLPSSLPPYEELA